MQQVTIIIKKYFKLNFLKQTHQEKGENSGDYILQLGFFLLSTWIRSSTVLLFDSSMYLVIFYFRKKKKKKRYMWDKLRRKEKMMLMFFSLSYWRTMVELAVKRLMALWTRSNGVLDLGTVFFFFHLWW